MPIANTKYQCTTNGFTVSVQTYFVPEQSAILQSQYCFAYKVCIENHTMLEAQLLGRNWQILNGMGHIKKVSGSGVIGLLPCIAPNEKFVYMSGCHLETPTGAMWGKYELQHLSTQESFFIEIPRFEMCYPYLNN